MVARSRLRKATKGKGAFDIAMGDYKMEGPMTNIPQMFKDLPTLKDKKE